VRALEARLDHERLHPLEWVNRRVRDRLGSAVRTGPFAGLTFPDWGLTGVDGFSPKIVGCYEQELHDAVTAAIAAVPPVVVNVGSAEGYYAVGLARELPQSTVIAYDTDAGRIDRLRAIADYNDAVVDARPHAATHASLRDDLVPGSLLVVDCDGPEGELLEPAAVPVLTQCRVIVEVHDLLVPGVSARLIAAFSPTHTIESIASSPRWIDDYPELGDLPYVTKQLAISEFRSGPMGFLVMVPRS
jgi:hypothetical protein